MIRGALLAMLVACGSSKPPPAPDAPAGPWTTFATLPMPRLEPGVTALGQQLIVLGGFDTDLMAGLEISSHVDVLDVTTGTWSTFPDAPVMWTHIQLAGIGTTLYLLGGLSGQDFVAHGDSFSLDTGDPTATWKTLAVMPAGLERGSAAVIVAPPRIYLLGGAATQDAVASNLFYDTDMDAWCPGAACTPDQQLPDLPDKRSHPAGARRADGTFVVAGGLGTLYATAEEADVWTLDPLDQVATGTWQTKTPMPTGRGGCAYGVLQGELVCAGGEAGQSALSVVETYDLLNDVWCSPYNGCATPPAMLPASRAGTQGAAIGEQLFVPGGALELQFEPLDTVFRYAPL